MHKYSNEGKFQKLRISSDNNYKTEYFSIIGQIYRFFVNNRMKNELFNGFKLN